MENTNFETSYEATSSQAKRERERFSSEQIQYMEQVFNRTSRPTSEVKDRIARELNTSKRRVQVWFQNRRSKSKRRGQPKPFTNTVSTEQTEEQADDNESQQPSANQVTYTDPDHLSTGNLSNMSLIRPSNRPTAFFYQPTYSLDSAFTEYDTPQQHQHYCPAILLHHPNQQHGYPSTRILPPLSSPQYVPPSVSLFPQGTLTSLYWRTPIFDHPQPHHPTGNTSNAPFLLSHETQQPRHTQPNPLNTSGR